MKDGRRDARERDNAARALAGDVIAGVCPNCRFQMDIDPQSAEGAVPDVQRGPHPGLEVSL